MLSAAAFLQDFTGFPAAVDLAAMREAVQKMGGIQAHQSAVPADWLSDHSVQVTIFGQRERVWF